MPILEPCPGCERHLQTSETQCPFCQQQIATETGVPNRVSSAKAIAQAALLAGSIAGATACTGGSDDGDRVDASTQVQADADPNAPDAMPPLPYGAPPARRRMV